MMTINRKKEKEWKRDVTLECDGSLIMLQNKNKIPKISLSSRRRRRRRHKYM